jgi:hypothetical protein
MEWSLMDTSSVNAIRRNAGREMMLRDDGWKGQYVRLQAQARPDADYLPLLMNSKNPLCCCSLVRISAVKLLFFTVGYSTLRCEQLVLL